MGVTQAPRRQGGGTQALVACPACDQPFPWPPVGSCRHCGADLAGPVAAAVFDLDREASALQHRRQARVEELRTGASAAALAALPPPTVVPADPVASPTVGARPSRLRPQTLLAAAGAVLLLAAAIVFIAVTWPTWPATAQLAFVASLTVVGAFAARAAATRQLPATADAVAVLTVGVAVASLLAVRDEGLAGLDRVDPVLWTAAVAATAAAVARPFATWAGLRDAVRRLGAVAGIWAAGSVAVWLAEAVAGTDPEVVVLAVAPALAVGLLIHGRWVLRPQDWARHVVPVAPAALLAGAAVTTGLVDLTVESAAGAAVAAVVGLPLLVWARHHALGMWTFLGAVLATLWTALLATLLLADATFGAIGLPAPDLVTFTLAATVIVVAARLRPPPQRWRDPVLAGAGVAALPAALVTVGGWAAAGAVVAEALLSPLTGWPPALALTATDLVLAGAAVLVVSVLLDRVRPDLVRPVAATWVGLILLAAAVHGAAAGGLPQATPLALAAAAAAGAAAWWQRDARRWPAVAVGHGVVLLLAAVDLDLLAVATAAVAVHLLWVAARRGLPLVAAAGTASALAAVAAATQTWHWEVVVTTIAVTALAGVVMVWAQFAPAGRTWRHAATDVVSAVAAVVATASAAAVDRPTVVAVQLFLVAIVAALHAARPGRGWSVWVSSAAASVAIWVLLGEAGVEVVEAYTLPAAAALAVAGAWRLHATTTSSWVALWPACAMAAVPTLVVLGQGPDPLRVLALATGAVVVALVGHRRGLAAPLAVGTAVAMIAAVVQLHYWTAHLPRWVTFAALGSVLIWSSATYEAQRAREARTQAHLRRLR